MGFELSARITISVAILVVLLLLPACDNDELTEDKALLVFGTNGASVSCPGDKNCSGRECGPDPVCEVSCGVCGAGETCQSGVCEGGVPAGIWKDSSSNHEWQVAPPGYKNWTSAKTYCQGLSLDGGGWRLPSIGELRTVIRGCPSMETGGSCGLKDSCLDLSCSEGCNYSPAALCQANNGPEDGCYWSGGLDGGCGGAFWSSSSVTDFEGKAWQVDFASARAMYGDTPYDGRVRCVR